MNNRYKWIHFIWLLPLFLLGLTAHQLWTYYNITYTYEKGESYTADVVEFDIKQIGAQTNGYVILAFTTHSGQKVERKLSLPVQLAAQFMESNVIPVRYKADSSTPIVMIKTYNTHRKVSLINASIAFISLLATSFIAWLASRFAQKKLRKSDPLKIIRTDV